jgi:hypothetical protein
VKSLSIFHNGRQQQQVAPALRLRAQAAAEFIPRLRFNRDSALGTELHAETRKQESDEMINLRHRRHSALAAAA